MSTFNKCATLFAKPCKCISGRDDPSKEPVACRYERGLFRYDVTACPTKVVPGAYGFIAQLNEGRGSKKRPTEFTADKVTFNLRAISGAFCPWQQLVFNVRYFGGPSRCNGWQYGWGCRAFMYLLTLLINSDMGCSIPVWGQGWHRSLAEMHACASDQLGWVIFCELKSCSFSHTTLLNSRPGMI